ncbi:MAG: efflux RND transporter permease subunit, partial [Planctomycetota bacterium]
MDHPTATNVDSSNARDNLTHSLVIGCVLVIVVLALFLFDWRAAVISSLAILLSLVHRSGAVLPRRNDQLDGALRADHCAAHHCHPIDDAIRGLSVPAV